MTDLSRPNHWTACNTRQLRRERKSRLALVDLIRAMLIVGPVLIGVAIAIGSIW